MKNQTQKIEVGTTLTARSVFDHNCIWTAKVIKRSGSFVTAVVDGEKEPMRKKVKTDHEGNEYVMLLGTYSMAPMFRVKKTNNQ